MIADVRGENRFDDDLTHVPVLSLTQKLKDIVLGVQEQFKGYGAVMVLQHALVVVAQGLCVAHRDQEGIIDARVLNVTQQARKETRHDVKVAEVLHQFGPLDEVVKVSRQINHFRDVVVGVLVICCVLDAADEIDEVLVCD